MQNTQANPESKPVTQEPTDTQMLDWVALYVLQVASLPNKASHEVEIEAVDDVTNVHVVRSATGATLQEALRNVIRETMKEVPRHA